MNGILSPRQEGRRDNRDIVAKAKKGTQSSKVANNRVWEGHSSRENPSPLVFSHWGKNLCFQKTGGQYYYLRDNVDYEKAY